MAEQRNETWGAVFRSWLIPGCLIALLVPGGPPSPSSPLPPAVSGCAVDLGLPLHLSLFPEGEMRPGMALGVRLEVVADRPVDDLEVTVRAPGAVRILAAPEARWGRARAREVRFGAMTVLVPADGKRRTVDVVVEATVAGVRIRRGASLNLAPGREDFREIVEPGGRRIREVRARRIG